ncbi:hypothetical protein MKW92_038209 [Papaver armeniacum]|nr:hypothetical protein MKW92_038209 [Papaver armeniacum]
MSHSKNDKLDSGLYTIIKVVRNEDLYQQIGRDVYCDLVDHDKVHSFQVLNNKPFSHFKEMVAIQFGVPLKFQRFWKWVNRANQTFRPYRPLICEEEKQHVGQLKSRKTEAGNWELILFLEGFELGPDLSSICLPHKTIEDILLFFKLYNPEREEIRYVGKLFVKGSAMPEDILKKLNYMANFTSCQEIKLYKETKFAISTPKKRSSFFSNKGFTWSVSVPTVKCELVDKERTFHANQLINGDIICFQRAHDPVQMKCRYPGVPSFLRCQALQEAKSKVIVARDELKKAEENMAPLKLKVIAMKDKLNKAEANMAPLRLKVIALKKELKKAEENMAPLQLTVNAIKNEMRVAEKNMAPLQTLRYKLNTAEENVAALETMIDP